MSNHSDVRNEVQSQIEDEFENDDPAIWEKASRWILTHTISMIWNNQIDGINFNCGGASGEPKLDITTKTKLEMALRAMDNSNELVPHAIIDAITSGELPGVKFEEEK